MTVGSIGGTYGLSGSGMDIDTIVKNLMKGQQAKADALLQKKTVAQWQKAAYNTVYDDISNFNASLLNFTFQSTLTPNIASSSAPSVATAKANGDAAAINHTLVVNTLAKGVKLTTDLANLIPPGATGVTPTGGVKLGTIANQFYGGTNPGDITITINNGLDPTVNAKTFTIHPTDSINDFISDINGAGINVQASYDTTLDRVFLNTTNTGGITKINISSTVSGDGTNDFIKKLGLFATGISTTVGPTTTTTYSSDTGNDASFTLDDTSLSEASNTFTISGVTYTLASTQAATVTIGVTNDVDTAVSNMQSLVDSYNKILAGVKGKVDEPRYTDYPPLTDEQKASMKDSDITLWNAKAQSGMLHNDTTLTSLLNTLRNNFSNKVSGINSVIVAGQTVTYNTAASIGITTGNYTEGGKLYLDTNKLKTALQNNPEVLFQLFGAKGTTTTNSSGKTITDINSQGIVGRLRDAISNTKDHLNQLAGTTINAKYDTSSNFAKVITDFNTQINNAKSRFYTIESTYYKQFNAMEVALQKMNSQSSWLSSQLSSSNG